MQAEELAEYLTVVDRLCEDKLAPKVDDYEARGQFPRDIWNQLGDAGLLGLPYPEQYDGAGLSYRDYLTVIERVSGTWLSVGLGISVHTLSCFPVATFGSEAQRERWLPEMLAGNLIGAYCLSEPHSGSDAAALRTNARREGDTWVISGTKAWITHGGIADFYNVIARLDDDTFGCFLVPGDAAGVSVDPPERKMGLKSSPTAQVHFDDVRVSADRLIGQPGDGFKIAMAALDAGRLGISACAVGLADAALQRGVDYARQREAFGHPIGDFQGVSFLLADASTAISASRALYRHAADIKDGGHPYSMDAAQAKLLSTDTAMDVTTDMVQVLGGAGYVQDHPVERYMREAKVLQIVEGTNQIQRLVIGRHLLKRAH